MTSSIRPVVTAALLAALLSGPVLAGDTEGEAEERKRWTTTTRGEPGGEPDNRIYFAEGRYDRTIRADFTGDAGASRDRNIDAGIINRFIAFGAPGTPGGTGKICGSPRPTASA